LHYVFQACRVVVMPAEEEAPKMVSFRVPPELHRRAKIVSARTGKSIQAEMLRVFRGWVEFEERAAK